MALHLVVGQRLADDAAQIGEVVARLAENGMGVCPRWTAHLMQTTAGCTPSRRAIAHDHRIFDVDGVFRRAVALRPAGRADGAVADRLDAVRAHEIEELRLLEVRMQLHFVDGRLDARVARAAASSLGMVMLRGADVAHQAEIDQLLHLPPGLHEVLVDVRPGVGSCAS